MRNFAKIFLISFLTSIIFILFQNETYAQTNNNQASASTSIPWRYPGKFWIDGGNSSPVEKGNIISMLYFEQGIELLPRVIRDHEPSNKHLIAFTSATITKDTKLFEYNNRCKLFVGAKLVRLDKHGIIELVGGYAHEVRFLDNTSRGHLEASLNTWHGWHPPVHNTSGQAFKRHPGSAWTTLGNNSPQEGNNIIFLGDIKQGTTLIDRRIDVVPFIHGRFGYDTRAKDWNRKILTGAGVEFKLPTKDWSYSLTVEYMREKRFASGLTGSQVSISANIFHGFEFSKRR